MILSQLDKESNLDGYISPNVEVASTMIHESVHCPLCGNGRGIPEDKLGRITKYTCNLCGYKFSESSRIANIDSNILIKSYKTELYRKKILSSICRKQKT